MTTRLDYDALHSFATTYVVDPYYRRQQATLLGLTLTKSGGLLKRKNPYLFRAKNIQTSGEFVKYALDAFLSSSEETMFGNFLERLAIHILSQDNQIDWDKLIRFVSASQATGESSKIGHS